MPRVIGKGGVGDMTQELQRAYFDVVTGNNPKYIDSLTYINLKRIGNCQRILNGLIFKE